MLAQNVSRRACTFILPSLVYHLHTSSILCRNSFEAKRSRVVICVTHSIQQYGVWSDSCLARCRTVALGNSWRQSPFTKPRSKRSIINPLPSLPLDQVKGFSEKPKSSILVCQRNRFKGPVIKVEPTGLPPHLLFGAKWRWNRQSKATVQRKHSYSIPNHTRRQPFHSIK